MSQLSMMRYPYSTMHRALDGMEGPTAAQRFADYKRRVVAAMVARGEGQISKFHAQRFAGKHAAMVARNFRRGISADDTAQAVIGHLRLCAEGALENPMTDKEKKTAAVVGAVAVVALVGVIWYMVATPKGKQVNYNGVNVTTRQTTVNGKTQWAADFDWGQIVGGVTHIKHYSATGDTEDQALLSASSLIDTLSKAVA